MALLYTVERVELTWGSITTGAVPSLCLFLPSYFKLYLIIFTVQRSRPRLVLAATYLIRLYGITKTYVDQNYHTVEVHGRACQLYHCSNTFRWSFRRPLSD